MSINILMPALSPTMEEGTLAKWLVKEGDEVNSGDLIAEIETDKATMEVEAVDEGVIGKILVSEGQESIKVNQPIAVLLEKDESLSDIEIENNVPDESKESIKETNVVVSDVVAPNNEPQDKSVSEEENFKTNYNPSKSSNSSRLFVTPLAKRLAMQKNIDLSFLKGSGPNGRILKFDVENFKGDINFNTNKLSISTDNSKIVKNSSMRKTIAERLVKSKNEAPHFYLSIDCNIEELLKARSSINSISNNEYKT